MKFFSILSALALTAVLSISGAQAQISDSRYIILFNKSAIPASANSKIARAGGEVVLSLPQVGIAIATSSDPEFVTRASGIKGVFSVGPEAVHGVPDATEEAVSEAHIAPDGYLDSGLLWGIERVHAPEAWAYGHTGANGTVLAVIDTGVAWNHPDLAPNVIDAQCFASGACNPYPSYSDHGTHVAGTAAAAFGGGAIVGVAPELSIASYNVFEPIADCGVCAFSSSRWSAMIDAANRGYEVITMSLGGTAQYGFGNTSGLATFVAAEKRIANYVSQMGTNMVASAGNSALDLTGNIVHIPGDIPGIVNTSATGIQTEPRYTEDSVDIIAFYSNVGAPVTIAGPGGDCGFVLGCFFKPDWFEHLILSSIVAPDPTCAVTADCPIGYGWKAGTSMATPHVSAVLALIRDENPGISPAQAVSILTSTADNIGSRLTFGHGMVNAEAATNK